MVEELVYVLQVELSGLVSLPSQQLHAALRFAAEAYQRSGSEYSATIAAKTVAEILWISDRAGCASQQAFDKWGTLTFDHHTFDKFHVHT